MDEEEDIPIEDLAQTNDMYLETLIELLKEKNITGAEFDKRLNELYPD